MVEMTFKTFEEEAPPKDRPIIVGAPVEPSFFYPFTFKFAGVIWTEEHWVGWELLDVPQGACDTSLGFEPTIWALPVLTGGQVVSRIDSPPGPPSWHIATPPPPLRTTITEPGKRELEGGPMNDDREIVFGDLDAFDMKDGRICLSIEDDSHSLQEILSSEQARALAEWILRRLDEKT